MMFDIWGKNGELFLIRGLPGSGKTTLAYKFWEYAAYHYESGLESGHITHEDPPIMCSNDDYFYQDRDARTGKGYGEYVYDGYRRKMAWTDCAGRVAEAMKAKRTAIFVHNTFARQLEINPYIRLAKQHGYKLTVMTCDGSYENTHRVPSDTIERMKANWEVVKL